ncbi:Serine/threonine-protein kinase OXI1 [Spatholobus suberectus]|nr:Serine/threonine-protein kinase OXI1 [Spatholobus suberectus]
MHGGDSGELRRGDTLDFRNLKVVSAVGRGAKGVVFLARPYGAASGEWLALKVVSKALLRKKNRGDGGCRRVSFERHILRRFDHPLLPRFRGAFETEQLVGFAIDYCHGGNLHSLRKKQSEKTFSEETIRFYAVELVLALEYLHNFGVVYRDLKPENVMVQETGHIMLVDFDLSKKLNPKSNSSSCNSSPCSDSSSEKDQRKRRFSRFNCYCHSSQPLYDLEIPSQLDTILARRSESDSVEKSNSFVGTEDYVAPEVISGKGHDFGVDWWSLGIVLYEMLYGTTPFKGANRKETFHQILTRELNLTGEMTQLRDLIKKLLEKDPNRRIEVDEIKGHNFFKGVKWDTVLQIARPPYIPQNEIEDSVGFSRKDVESFVHGIFFPKNKGEGDKTSEGEQKRNEKQKEDDNNNHNNKNVWVDKLNQNSTKNEIFLIF